MSEYDAIFRSLAGEADKGTTAPAYDSIFRSVVRKSPEERQNAKLKSVPMTGTLQFKVPFGPTLDSGIPLPPDMTRALAQYGAGVADWGVAFADPATVDQKRREDASLVSEGAGKAMKFAGQASPTLGIPFGWLKAGGKLAPTVEGALVGAGIGATQPVGTGESRGFNATAGAVGGAAIPAAIAGLRELSRPSQQMLPILQTAKQEGIPFGLADTTQNKVVKSAASWLQDLVGGGNQRGKQDAINAAWARKVGETGNIVDAATIAAAKKGRGAEMEAIWSRNDLQVSPSYFQRLQSIKQEAANLDAASQRRVLKWVDEFEGAITEGQNSQAIIPGQTAFARQSKLRQIVESASGEEKRLLSDLRKSTIDAFNGSVTGQEAAALTKARGQYRVAKTLEPIVGKTDTGGAGRLPGDIPNALIPNAIAQNFPNMATGLGREVADLAAVTSHLGVDRVPQTGGSLRALLQNSFGLGIPAAGFAAGGIPGALALSAATGGGLNLASRGLNRPGLLNALNSGRLDYQPLIPASLLPGLLSAPPLE